MRRGNYYRQTRKREKGGGGGGRRRTTQERGRVVCFQRTGNNGCQSELGTERRRRRWFVCRRHRSFRHPPRVMKFPRHRHRHHRMEPTFLTPPRATQSNGIELFPLIFNFPTFATAFRDRGKRGMINRIGVIPTNDLIRLNLPSSLRRFPGRGDGQFRSVGVPPFETRAEITLHSNGVRDT